MITVGKIHVDQNGAGRIYVPKSLVQCLDLEHKDQLKLEALQDQLTAKALKNL